MGEQQRINLFGIDIDAVTLQQAAERVCEWSRDSAAGRCRYVVTPNVDHVVMYQENARLRAAYDDAALILADGAPLIAAARLLRRPLPERVAGSDLVPALFDVASADVQDSSEHALSVFLLGAASGVAERAAERIHARWRGVRVVDVYSPPMGFEHDAAECRRIAARINAAAPDVLLIGLGAPKQELWIAESAPALRTRVALCIGATIDFLADEKRRAPLWMQRFGIEWLHRLISEPRRLARRYLRDALIFPRLLWREFLRGSNA